MRIAEIKLRNFECYRGEHVLTLAAKNYAVVARRLDNPERSNWSGKSALLRSVVFGLYGVHGHRSADGWISRGEKSGEVQITFDDGSRVIRTRSGAQSTKCWWYARGVAAAMNEEADVAIVKALGLTHDDFCASSYFEQRAMSRLVTMRPSDRTQIVNEWFRMGALASAEKIESEQVSRCADRAQELERARGIQTALIEAALRECNSKTLAEMREDLAGVERELKDAQAGYEAARGAIEANEARQVVADAKARLEALTRDGKALAEEVEAGEATRVDEDGEPCTVGELADRCAREAARYAEDAKRIDRDLVQKRRLAAGQFDGRCPVAPIECPARSKINTMRDEHARAVSQLTREGADAEQAAHHARAEADQWREAVQALDRKRARLESMREEAARLVDQIERGSDEAPSDRDRLRSAIDRAQQTVVELRTERDAYQRSIAAVEKATRELERIDDERDKLRGDAELARASLAILGKQGIQRRLAEGALGEIEDLARAMLTEAGIGLDLAIRWSREGSGLASSCEACGLAFPTSARVKACERCGTQRGPNVVNKLEIELSNRSGAADDLAGAAIQLAASAWLRADRGSPWAVTMLDEPFSQLDKALRRSFSAHLAAFLSTRYQVEQAFVISHSPDTVEQLPGRIEIVSDGEWSVPRVVA